jgi:hypothetical protein
MSRFIRVQHRMVNLDSIAYVDFLDSGRAMIFMMGLTQEKQNIPVDPQDAIKLRAMLEGQCMPDVDPLDVAAARRPGLDSRGIEALPLQIRR